MSETNIQTGQRWTHIRTGGDYVVIALGMMKSGPRERPWEPSVTYQSLHDPKAKFTRDRDHFEDGFELTIERSIRQRLEILGMKADTPRGKIDNWFVFASGKDEVLMGDIVDHADTRKIGQDATTSALRHIDKDLGYAITRNTVYYLINSEVVL